MSYITDTIAAISTPIGHGGIGIIRISGSKSVNVLEKIFKCGKKIKNLKSHTITFGKIYDDENNILDEVLVSIMLAPKSYTTEDIVEINCHGGIAVVKRILQEVLKHDIRLAESGEFTKRAFLNGRIDLAKSEAVMDLINATTEISRQAAISQLSGVMSLNIKNFRDEILTMMAHIEASIDYPEHDLEHENIQNISVKIDNILLKINELLKTSGQGKLIIEGINTAILGKPNVGKSSLLNVFLQEERAIVTDIAGTTRDVLSEYIDVNGIKIKLIDTAGIRKTTDTVEKIGVNKSKELINTADLILCVLDGSEKLSTDDIELLELIKDKNVICIINKTDLQQQIEIEIVKKYINESHIINTSLLNEKDIKNVYDIIIEMFFNGEISYNNQAIITNIRHKNSIQNAKNSILKVADGVNFGMPEDLLTIDLKDAYKYLGEVTGETVEDDLIDKIFSEFCLGK